MLLYTYYIHILHVKEVSIKYLPPFSSGAKSTDRVHTYMHIKEAVEITSGTSPTSFSLTLSSLQKSERNACRGRNGYHGEIDDFYSSLHPPPLPVWPVWWCLYIVEMRQSGHTASLPAIGKNAPHDQCNCKFLLPKYNRQNRAILPLSTMNA